MDIPEDVQEPAKKCVMFVFSFFDHDLLHFFPSLFSNFPLLSCSMFQMVCILEVLSTTGTEYSCALLV